MTAAHKPVDELLRELVRSHPEVLVQRLLVKHAGDDDNLWFVNDGHRDVQFDCQPDGGPPFLVEGGDDERVVAETVDEALAAVHRLMAW